MKEDVGQLIGGQQLRTIDDHRSIYEACAVMDEFNIGALAVVREGMLIGIVSERDVIRRAVIPRRTIAETTVAEIMTPNPKVIEASSGPAEALNIMIDGHFRHLPVVRNGCVAGMLSIRDIPVDTWYMKRRYEEIMATPAVVAEAAVNQRHQTELREERARLLRRGRPAGAAV